MTTEPEMSFLTAGVEPEGKRQILLHALRLFTSRGLCETSIRDIGAAAGLTNPALYKHFAGKDALALELFVVCYRELIHRIERAVQEAEGPEERVAALVAAYTGLLDEAPETVLYVNAHLQRFWPEVPRALGERTLATLVRERLLDAPPGAAEVRVAAILGTLGQVARMMHLGGLEKPASRWADELTDAILRLVR